MTFDDTIGVLNQSKFLFSFRWFVLEYIQTFYLENSTFLLLPVNNITCLTQLLNNSKCYPLSSLRETWNFSSAIFITYSTLWLTLYLHPVNTISGSWQFYGRIRFFGCCIPCYFTLLYYIVILVYFAATNIIGGFP